jgi:hypothetical protein
MCLSNATCTAYNAGNASATLAAFRAKMAASGGEAGAGSGGGGAEVMGHAVWGGGFDPSSQVDECAAHACYGEAPVQVESC